MEKRMADVLSKILSFEQKVNLQVRNTEAKI